MATAALHVQEELTEYCIFYQRYYYYFIKVIIKNILSTFLSLWLTDYPSVHLSPVYRKCWSITLRQAFCRRLIM